MAMVKYQRLFVVLASSMRFSISIVPKARAVSKPNVGTPSGSGRSLSMVFGTWTTLIVRPILRAYSETAMELNAVSSPPMVTRCVTPSSVSVSTTVRRSDSFFVGLKRDIFRMQPPVR